MNDQSIECIADDVITMYVALRQIAELGQALDKDCLSTEMAYLAEQALVVCGDRVSPLTEH